MALKVKSGELEEKELRALLLAHENLVLKKLQIQKKTVSEAKKKRVSAKAQALIKKRRKEKVATIIASTAAVTSGALWVASAFVPGMPALNTIAAVSNIVGMAAGSQTPQG